MYIFALYNVNKHSMLRQKRKKSETGICHVMKGKESKTCPCDSSCTILVHEWYSQGKFKIGDEFNNHSQAYKNVMNDKTFYPKTIPMYKAFIKKAYNMYKSKEKR